MNKQVSQYSLLILDFTHLANILVGGQTACDSRHCSPISSDVRLFRVRDWFQRRRIGQCHRYSVASIANKPLSYYSTPKVVFHVLKEAIRKQTPHPMLSHMLKDDEIGNSSHGNDIEFAIYRRPRRILFTGPFPFGSGLWLDIEGVVTFSLKPSSCRSLHPSYDAFDDLLSFTDQSGGPLVPLLVSNPEAFVGIRDNILHFLCRDTIDQCRDLNMVCIHRPLSMGPFPAPTFLDYAEKGAEIIGSVGEEL